VKFHSTALSGVILVEPAVFRDARGFFMETYHQERFADAGIDAVFVQDNHSSSQRGAVRGLHYQIERPQGKLVRVVAGEIFDVAVDLRRGSPTFGRWFGAPLSAENHLQMWVPAGFAHGFSVTSEHAEVIYKCTNGYYPKGERGLRWDDPDLGITWPVSNPILSDKDKRAPLLREVPPSDLFEWATESGGRGEEG